MTKEQKETIKRANEIIKNGFDSEDDIELILDKLLNLIQQLQEENKQKDKMIYLTTKFIWETGARRRGFTCCFAKECNKHGCEICIKQYFKKKASEE